MKLKYMDNKTILRIDTILKHIDQILNDVNNVTLESLKNSSLLLRATCFSIAQIGEMMNQLETALGEKYYNLPWVPARRMRNIIVHDYGMADVEQVYSILNTDLPSLRAAFLAIRNDVTTNTLTTDRCVLRKVHKEDAELIFKNWASDPEVTKYMTWNAHENIDVTKQIINMWLEEEKDPKTIRYIITFKDSGEPIGSIDVVHYVDGNPEIGYCLSRNYWNKGIMTEACKAFVKYLINIGFTKILIRANENNIGSNKVIEKCGFKFTHKKELEHCSPFKPERVTVNCYELVLSKCIKNTSSSNLVKIGGG